MSALRLAAVAACVAWSTACSGDGGASSASDAGTHDSGAHDSGVPSRDAGTVPDSAAPPSCDDENPCTDDRTENGECVHRTAPDGAPCSDGLRCTGDDRCLAGVCIGNDLTPRVAARGALVGYGAPPNEDGLLTLVGLGEVVSDDHLLFAETLGVRELGLSLVRTSATGLERLDTKRIDMALRRAFLSRDWSELLATFFIRLGADRTVLVSTRERIELFDTSSGKIASLATFALHPQSDDVLAGAGRGSRFYTCNLRALNTWEIDAAGAIQQLGRFATKNDCRSLSLSADGTELLVASSNGIDRIDVSTPSVIAFKPGFASGRAFARVDANADFIVGQRQGLYGVIADIEVYRRSDLEADPAATPAVTFASTGTTSLPSRLPLGFALLDGRVAVESVRNNGTETTYTTELYALPGIGAPTRSFVHRRVRDPRLPVGPVPIAGGGRHLIVPPWRTVLRDDTAHSALTPLSGPEQAGFEVVTPRGTDRLTAFSSLSQHEVDLHDPDAPTVSSTASLPVDLSFLRWERNGRNALTAPISLPSGSLEAGPRPTPVSCLARTPSNALALAGTVTIPTPGRIADLGSAMLEVEPVATGQFSVRWFDAPPACDGRTLDARLDGTIELHPGDKRKMTSWAFDGDPSGAPTAVIAELRRESNEPFTTTLAWLEPAPDGTGWRTAAEVDLQGSPEFVIALRMHGDRAVLTDGRRVMVARRTGTKIEIIADRELEQGGEREELTQILRFDGELVYLASRQPTTGVIVLRARDLARLARFETHGLVRSMAEVGDQLVLGSSNALDVADVVCPR